MKYIIRNRETQKVIKELNSFPTKYQGSPIEDFDYDNNEIFVIVEEVRPDYDTNKSYLRKTITYTEDFQPGFYQVKVCRYDWKVVNHSKETVIQKLNESLGIYLDEQYPIWERIKHAGEGNYILLAMIEGDITQDQLDRKTYIDTVYDWITQCRADRDIRENEFVNNDIFPSFEWTDRP